jgi:nucleoside-diphosphate-sugar epimerase
MKKKVLIIGGAGFVGLNIAKYLSENRDYEITIADNFFRGNKDEILKELVDEYGIRVIEGDLTNPSAFNQFDNNYDYVYMLASVVGVDYTFKIPNELIRINTSLILNTLEWLKNSKCKKVLYTSTSECYAGTIESCGYSIPTDEKVPLCIDDIAHPRFTYAVTKMLGESGFHNYSRVFGFEVIIIRYHNVYGPRMGFKHVIPHIAQRFIKNEDPFMIYGADQTRAFCYISDAIEGTVAAMESSNSNGKTYHIGTMEEISIEDLIRYTGKIVGFKGSYKKAPTYPGSVSRRCPDISKAKKELNYNPKVTWKEGLEKTINWYYDYLKSGKKHKESFYE